MARFQPGDVVIAEFIFTDYSQTKRRPAVIIAAPAENNYLACSITSQASHSDPFRIELKSDGLIDGHLPRDSYIRPNMLMTLDHRLIHWKQGVLPRDRFEEVRKAIVKLVMGDP
jgi:mRNA interferase MazF